jgi:hypothetical protein
LPKAELQQGRIAPHSYWPVARQKNRGIKSDLAKGCDHPSAFASNVLIYPVYAW